MKHYQLLDFQRKTVADMLSSTFNNTYNSPFNLLLNSPTGSGKTFMMSRYYQNFLNVILGKDLEDLEFENQILDIENDVSTTNLDKDNLCFIWLSPGIGELEEQNFNGFKKYLQNTQYAGNIKNIDDIIRDKKFITNNIYFINWELLVETKDKKSKIGKNEAFVGLDTLIQNTINGADKNIKFVLFIDEAHRNAIKDNLTAEDNNATKWIKKFNPVIKIRISATLEEKIQKVCYGIAAEEDITDLNPKISEEDILRELSHKGVNVKNIVVNETDVVSSGLITSSTEIDYETEDMKNIEDNDNTDGIEPILRKSVILQTQIKNEFHKLYPNKTVNPLILIQIPSDANAKKDSDEDKTLKTKVLEILEKIDPQYTVEHSKVAIWLSQEKTFSSKEDLIRIDSPYMFLIIKQAVATGWDCPRAKILVKLRKTKEPSFEIQTIGRIQRTLVLDDSLFQNGKIKRYKDENGDTLLLSNTSFIYTNDAEFRLNVKKHGIGNSETPVRNIKKKPNLSSKTTLLLQEQSMNDISLGSKEMAKIIENAIVSDMQEKMINLTNNYSIDDFYNLFNRVLDDQMPIVNRNFIDIPKITYTCGTLGNENTKEIQKSLNKNSREFKQAVREIATSVSVSYETTFRILSYLFNKNENKRITDKNGVLLPLNETDFCNFVYNARTCIYRYLRMVISKSCINNNKAKDFLSKLLLDNQYSIPENDSIKETETNCYEDHSDKDFFDGLDTRYFASKVEKLFYKEMNKYACRNNQVEFFYKNGESNEKYFRIVYLDNFLRQHYFYPDFIVKMKSGKFYIIETKGEDNIDQDAENKFYALKFYVQLLQKQGIDVEFYFIRNEGNDLRFNNKTYSKLVGDTYLDDNNNKIRYWKKFDFEKFVTD